MSRIIFVLLVILAMFSAAASGQECGSNEEFTTCGTQCPLTCGESYVQACPLQCVIGCQCKPGYVRDDNGICVRPEAC